MSKVLFSTAVFSFIILCCFQANAQHRINGTIVDQKGEAVAFATAALRERNVEDAKIRQADSLGHFSFLLSNTGTYRLSVYALGFASQNRTVDITGDTTLHILLHPLTEDLKGITIVGSKPIIERKPDRVIFHVNESLQTAGSNGLEMLRKVPGLHINNDYISLAGKGAMGIMVNGRTLHLSEKTLMNYLNSFSSDQIDRVEVITNPTAQYEAEGNAGLINIITKKNTGSGWSGSTSGMIKRFFYKDQPDYHGIKNYGDIAGNAGLYYNSEKWSIY